MNYTNIIYKALFVFFLISVINGTDISRVKITGLVVDKSTKDELPGANIMIKGSNKGTASNESGVFSLTGFETHNFTISVSMVGYETKTIELNLLEPMNDTLVVELREGMIEMGSVVVTGTNTTHLYENVPVRTEIIHKSMIEKKFAANLAEALSFQTGLSVDNECNNCNFTQVRILGFDGKYSQILIDGAPAFSSLGGVYGLEHFPKEMIEQIEVVKGSGSALYGSGAISGTINLMTRRPAYNSTRINYLGQTISGIYDQQIGLVSELVSEDGLTGAYIFGSTRTRQAYDRNNDGFTELGELQNETIGFNFYHRLSKISEINLSLHRIHEERRGGSDLSLPIHESRTTEWAEHFRWGGKANWIHRINTSFDYNIHYAFSLTERDSYYGGLADNTPEEKLNALKFYGYAENPNHSGGLQTNLRISNHTFSSGIQYYTDKLIDKSTVSEDYYVNSVFKNLGIYLQDEIVFGERNQFTIVAGGRIDKHSVLENWVFSPRINLLYSFMNGAKIRIGYGSGFKAPQIFDEDLHIGGLEGDQKIVRNINGLKEEKSQTLTAGFEFQNFVGNTPILIGLTSFYTRLADAYSLQFLTKESKYEIWQRINSSGAKVWGIEFDFGIKPTSHLEIRSGLTYKRNTYDDKLEDFDTKNFIRTPDLFGHLNVMLEITESLNLFGALKYMGEMDVPHEIALGGNEDPLLVLEKSPKFFEIDLGISYNLNIMNNLNSKISLGIKNLTDQYQKDLDYGVNRDPAYVYGPSNPRTMYLSIDTSF